MRLGFPATIGFFLSPILRILLHATIFVAISAYI